MPPGVGYPAMLRGAPLGSIGATRVDVTPALEMYRQSLQKQLAQAQLEEQQAGRLQDLSLANMRLQTGVQEAEKARQFEAGEAAKGRAFQAGQAAEGRKLTMRGQDITRTGQREQTELGRAKLAVGVREGQKERELRRELKQQDVELSEKQLELREAELDGVNERFAKSLGLKREEFNLSKTIRLADKARQDAHLSMAKEMHEVEKAYKNGLIDQQEYVTAKLRHEASIAGLALQEAREELEGQLSAEQWEIVYDFVARGDEIPPRIMAAISDNKKARESLLWFQNIMRGFSEEELTEERKESLKAERGLTEARIEAQEIENAIVRQKIDGLPDPDKKGKLTKKEKAALKKQKKADDALRELLRKADEGTLGEVGQVRVNVLEKLQEVEDDNSDAAKARRKDLKRIVNMLNDLELEDDDELPGNLAPDWTSARLLNPIGLAHGAGRLANRLRMEAGIGDEGELRDLLDEYGLEP